MDKRTQRIIAIVGFGIAALALLWALLRRTPGVGQVIRAMETGATPFEAFSIAAPELTGQDFEIPEFLLPESNAQFPDYSSLGPDIGDIPNYFPTAGGKNGGSCNPLSALCGDEGQTLFGFFPDQWAYAQNGALTPQHW